MSREHLTFTCEGSALVGTLDTASGTTGLLIVSGGNEIRAGAFSGQAVLAARIAANGFPVFRFDRRGVGDSEGENGGFRTSAPDIAAACALFRSLVPQMDRLVAFGNCDAASALMLAGGGGGDALVLSNPWTFDSADAASTAPAVVRAHYRARLRDPAAIKRLLRGEIRLGGLIQSVRQMLRPPPPPSSLMQDMAGAMGDFTGAVRFLVAGRDQTGLAFLSAWDKNDARVALCPAATHSYVEPESRDWLEAQLLAMLQA